MDDVLRLLELDDVDDVTKAKLETIWNITSDRLRMKLGTETVPAELSYIITEVTVARFNRIGSEGLSSHTVEGETMNWSNDDFEPYKDDIQAWIDEHQNESRKGRIRFI